ncbi:MAG TPA: GT4 family glycosyltransferase PelF [Polyangia bacterium]|nr:GT4 family glycosyltransferase PelF [Polyangia bacterium]
MGTVDICLLVEGTYPFVAGGVSSWVHDMLLGQPHLRFAILNIGSHPAAYGEPRYQLPDNVTGLHKLFCQEAALALDAAARAEMTAQIRLIRQQADARPKPSRTLAAFRRMHLENEVDAELLADLSSGDLSIAEFLHGRASFELLTEIAEKVAPDAPFLDLFWHFRAIHVPLLRILSKPVVEASCYHAVSTGYAGLLAAVWSHRSGRPLAVTEHGIYARERDLELSRVDWIRDHHQGGAGAAAWTWAPRTSPLRGLWSRFFRTLSRVAYRQATRIVTLSDINRRKQVADGAPEVKIEIVPNGVDLKAEQIDADARQNDDTRDIIPLQTRPLRVGFVGRVVPIKDVITFIKACDIALPIIDLDVRIIGPAEEDPEYAKRCRTLVDLLRRTEQIKFLGSQPPAQIYPDLDLVVLTSFSEGQPLVILEAYAEGLPVIASDVGACREMIEGRLAEDRAFGPSGIVTRVAAPKETAAAMVLMAKDSRMRRRMGMAGRKRVTTFYQRREMLAKYRALYDAMVSP